MASEWQELVLGDVAKFRAGSAFKLEYQGLSSGELPFIKVSDLNLEGNEHVIHFSNNWISRDTAKTTKIAIHPPGATVFAKIGVALTYNRRRMLVRETAIDNNLMSAAPDLSLIRPEYLYFLLKSLDFNEIAHGSALPYLNQGDLTALPIHLPPFPEQDVIAGVLLSIENRIDNLRATNATLEAIAQALFKSWFVDFEPVHAKAEGRAPEGMDAATATLFPSEFEDSELGSVPKGWKIMEIGKAVKCVGGATPSTKEDAYWVDGTHCWATPKDLSGLAAPVLAETARKITDAGLDRISSGLLPKGTLLMSSRAPIGYLAITAVPTAINQGFIAMLPGGELPPLFLLCWAKANMDTIKQAANGSTFMEISKRAFRPMPVLVPSPAVVSSFHQLSRPLFEKIELNERKAKTLADLRDTLLPRLISGKLRVTEIPETDLV